MRGSRWKKKIFAFFERVKSFPTVENNKKAVNVFMGDQTMIKV